MRFDCLACEERTAVSAGAVTLIGAAALGLLVVTSTSLAASDAAVELADRFAGSATNSAATAKPETTTPRTSDRSAARVQSVLDTLRDRIESSHEVTPAPSKERATAAPAIPAVPPARNAQPATATSQDAQPLRGNDVFGDGRSKQPREAEPRSITSWARPSMGRQGESFDAAPVRPTGPIERVSILLVMKPGNRGIRRFNKTADPIVCVAKSCFISRGPTDAARAMRRRKAFGTINTLGKRAGACQNRRTCIFRDVRLDGGSAEMQPIDLRLLRHDRRELSVVSADRTCGIFRGRLTCANAVESDTYTAWIVPEDVAVEAGVRVLEAALQTRLSGPRSAALQN